MPRLFTGLLAERLNSLCPLHVREAAPDNRAEPGVIDIARGDWHLELTRDMRLRLNQNPPENFCRPSVDVLFRTAAQVCAGRVLGVVLTGMGSDGLAGSRAIRSAGGCVFAQDGATSVVWGMPGAVANAGLANKILPLDAIPAEILRYVASTCSAPAPHGGRRPVTSSALDFEYLRAVVMRNSGNQVDPSRDYLFESRLQRLLRDRGLQSLSQLVSALRSDPGANLQRSVAEAMTINETSFFRDTSTFDLLREQLLPALIAARQTTRTLRFWSAASSSGQEAYSLAMLLREHFPLLAGWKIDILGTDISAEMVERSSAGRYQRIEVNRGLPARFLVKYLVRTGDEWEIHPDIKRLCRFHQRNLCQPFPTGESFDVIFLRNVMIYFPQDTRRHVLLGMHRSLARDGVLFLGLSEQPRMDTHWQTMLTPKTVWYKPISA